MDKRAAKTNTWTESDIKKRAASSWSNQQGRCYRQKNKDFSIYGGKGIKIDYTRKEFLDWFLVQFKKSPKNDPVCGRIDHSKNYSFENIELVERKANSKEVWARHKALGKNIGGNKKRPINVYCVKTGAWLARFKSTREAARKTENSQGNLITAIQRKGSSKGFSFSYAD